MKSIVDVEFDRKWLPAIALFMMLLAFVAGLSFELFLMPWLRADDVPAKPVQQCKDDLASVEAELTRIRRECIKPR